MLELISSRTLYAIFKYAIFNRGNPLFELYAARHKNSIPRRTTPLLERIAP
jgi:hypothetical protein